MIMPNYMETLFLILRKKKIKNTRKKSEVELRKQLFVIIDSQTHLIYISDISRELEKNICRKNYK